MEAQQTVQNGGLVSASTSAVGNAGDLNINANQFIKLSGTSPDGNSRSGLLAVAFPDAKGTAGNITINTGELLVEGGAEVSAKTFSPGNGGNLTVIATKKVELVGRSVKNNRDTSGLFIETGRGQTGNGGELKIETPKLSVQDGAEISTKTSGEGNAGNLTINADSIQLNSNTIFNANTQSINKDPNKPQATITLNSTDLILREGSKITTNATGRNVIGGNININTEVLAVLDNSSINANSTDFRGGRVTIKSEGVFGRQSWYPEILKGEITANGRTSELSGTVEISTLNVDPSRGIAELPGYVVNAAALINQNFCARAYASSFIITGRGGIASSPFDVFAGETTWEDWRINPVIRERGQQERVLPRESKETSPRTPIIEAQGWIVNDKGQVELVASTQNVIPHRLQSLPVEFLSLPR
ncbi:MAG: S-layer family protein [Scytonematopsis contorta HA4267-MV1]|nr:S-layer family protein [Scytonematopsis contorta HA4267-MV1]